MLTPAPYALRPHPGTQSVLQVYDPVKGWKSVPDIDLKRITYWFAGDLLKTRYQIELVTEQLTAQPKELPYDHRD